MSQIVQQYLLYGVLALLGTIIFLWLYNRRENRRKHALALANIMREWGLSWFAEGYDFYAVGDYSGLAYKVKEVVSSVRSDEAMVMKLKDVTRKVTTYAVKNDVALAGELREILKLSITPNTPPPSTN